MIKKILFFILLLYSSRSFSQSPFLIEEGFNTAPTAPSGWYFSSGITTYTASKAGMSGKSVPALHFHNKDTVVTTSWTNGDQITFLMRADNTTAANDKMKVEVYDGSSWSTLATLQPHDKAVVTTLSISSSITQARFTYKNGSEEVSLDDFTVRKAGSCTGNSIKLEFVNVDACSSGCEGTDEFLTFVNSGTSLNIGDIEFSYPDADNNNNSVTFCGTSPGSPCANYFTTNSSQVSALNSTAGCTIFLTPPASIPANARVMVFNGSAQTTLTDFSSLCSSGVQYYAIYTNTTDCNGRFGNYSTSGDPYRDMFLRNRATGCTDTNYYFTNNIGLSDGNGNSVDGASVAYTASTPQYIMTACDNFVVLPISLLFFNATEENNTVVLTWATASEQNNNYFTIERSADGTNYKTIGTVAGAGTSSSALNYSFDDKYPLKRTSYYRLRQTDYNGNFTLSKTIAVNNKNASSAYIYPNPFNDKVHFDISLQEFSGTIKFTLTNNIGQVVASEERSFNSVFSNFELNYEYLPSGVYILKAESGNFSENFKLIKN